MSDTPAAPRQSILIVDDDVEALRAMDTLLSNDYEVRNAASGEQALQMVKEKFPDLVLLDITMQGISGLEVLELLRKEPRTQTLPIILVSALSDTEDIVAGLRKGANDYITKPVNPEILIARMQAHLKVSNLVHRLEEANELLGTLASSDELTGIPNRRSLLRELESEFRRSLRYNRPLSLLMLDLDNFKQANNLFGHSGGDAVLKQFVNCVQNALRSTDLLCRYGGEEFCALLPETPPDNALSVAERVREAVEQCPFSVGGEYTFMTVSVGVDTVGEGGHKHFMELIEAADQALHQAKEEGKNRVVLGKKNGSE